MTARVVSIGNAMVDVVARVPSLPVRGGDVLARGGRLEIGGGGFRTCVAASAAGAEAVFAGRIGGGVFGDLVVDALEDARIEAPLPRIEEADTGYVLALLEPDGERTFATVPGAESAPLGLDAAFFRPDDVVHVHGYGLMAPGRAGDVADLVTSLPPGVVVVLDPGPFGADAEPGALARVLGRTDWWTGNVDEAQAVTGLEDRADAARLLGRTVRAGAVVRDGADGCVVAIGGGERVHLPSPPVVAVDTNGAGDTHVGTFLAGLAAGVGPVDAARVANAAAARFVAAAR